MDIKKRVEEEVPEIIHNMERLIRHQSYRDKAEEQAPFGRANAEVLDEALDILDGYGFRTACLDHYAGYGETGQGDVLIGMVGHLDVVPADPRGWSTDPYQLVEKEDGNLYGRGSYDDKGPVCCAIAAMRIVQQLRPDMKKRIRMVMGCNEESGSAGLAYYVKKEGDFDYGFTPDADFPCIHGEKGMCMGHFEVPTEKILSIQGGSVPNAVCGEVSFTAEKGSFDESAFRRALNARKVKYSLKEEGGAVKGTVYGVKAHASTPDKGVNAILEAFAALDEAGMDDPAVRFMARRFGRTCHGEKLGIDFADAYGDLTLNVGVISLQDHVITGTIDIRFPVTRDPEEMKKSYLSSMKDDPDGGKIFLDEFENPLFFAPDHPLVQSLYNSYVEVTGDRAHQPMVIGGGTYAKGIRNTIAFGAEFPDGPDIHMHGDDEFIPKEYLARITEIYVKALLNLLDL